MGMGEEDASIRSAAGVAAGHLRLLQEGIGQPRSRPAGPPGRTRNPHPAGPIPAGLVDAMSDARREMIEHTRAANPDAGPAPGDAVEIMRWMVASTTGTRLGAAKKRAAAALIYRQGLEYALAAGDTDVIRRERCPGCGCWSLFWKRERQRAVCIVVDCLTSTGRPSTWSLQQIAAEAVEKSPVRAAT